MSLSVTGPDFKQILQMNRERVYRIMKTPSLPIYMRPKKFTNMQCSPRAYPCMRVSFSVYNTLSLWANEVVSVLKARFMAVAVSFYCVLTWKQNTTQLDSSSSLRKS